MNTKYLSAVLAIAGLALTAASQAAEPATALQPASKVVQYGDLNLSNAAGAQRLYSRIVGAAQLVCKDHAGPRLPEEQARTRICIQQSIERAVTQVNDPTLMALYVAKKNGTPAPSAVMASNR